MSRLIAYIGSYGAAPNAPGGGIYAVEVLENGAKLRPLAHYPDPKDAGYLVYSSRCATLYAVDERKTDGRGPVNPAAAVHAFRVDRSDGTLHWLNSSLTVGPRPTFLDFSEKRGMLISANHGDFQHVEKVRQAADGSWGVEYVYDDSTIVMYGVDSDGALTGIKDVFVPQGHGKDPNFSPQNGGHAQSSPHAHCAVLDKAEKFLLVCDKGTDRIYTLSIDDQFAIVSTLQMPEETAPRHISFGPDPERLYVSCELSSELLSCRYDRNTGALTLIDRASTTDDIHTGVNEPAEVRAHPTLNFVYVNNRGEDSLAWFSVSNDGLLQRLGAVALAQSVHPGLAARSFTFSGNGDFVLVADRPAHLVRSYRVDPDGSLHAIGEITVPDPAYIEFVKMEG